MKEGKEGKAGATQQRAYTTHHSQYTPPQNSR